MNVTTRRYADAVVLSASGRLDQDSCDDFRAQLLPAVETASHDGGSVVIDLSGVEYVSSAGLRCFMLASRQARESRGKVAVAALQPMVAEIFEISHFNMVFPVYPTVAEALGSVSRDAARAYQGQ